MTTIGATLRAAIGDEERRDLEVLVASVLGVDRAYLYAHSDESLPPTAAQRVAVTLGAYRSGEPVAYLIGRREFWSLELDVSPAVLIPRPETELLVELTLQHLPPSARVLDLGTGSGAIAIAIAKERSDCHVTATDASAAALDVARRNASKHRMNVTFALGDWFRAVDAVFDVIVSNPPYVAEADPHLDSLVSEPRLALIAGDDGLAALRIIVAEAPGHLCAGGWLLVEHGFDQAPHVRHLFVSAGFAAIETIRDFAGHERVTLGKR